jgi:hypothetical protein
MQKRPDFLGAFFFLRVVLAGVTDFLDRGALKAEAGLPHSIMCGGGDSLLQFRGF